eukprot:NODE_12_length_54577_cov_0.384100.p3 type:complete len:793 gc:universal NODE_12_length_54577_cov_0.384100:19039-21417(+)
MYLLLINLNALLSLTVAPLEFQTQNGTKQPIYSVRLTGFNPNDIVQLSANIDTSVCQSSCSDLNTSTPQSINPINNILSFYTPIISQYLIFHLYYNANGTNATRVYEIHPFGTSLSMMQQSAEIPSTLKPILLNLNQFHKHTNHIHKRDQQTKYDPNINSIDHHPNNFQSTLFRVKNATDIPNSAHQNGLSRAFHAMVHFISKIGHTFIGFIKSIVLLFNWQMYTNIIHFQLYYIQGAFETMWVQAPVAQTQFSSFLDKLKYNNSNSINNAPNFTQIKETHITENVELDGPKNDPRALFVNDHVINHVNVSSKLSNLFHHPLNMIKSLFSNGNVDVLNSPVESTLKFKSLSLLQSVSNSTFPLMKSFHESMMDILRMPLGDLPILNIFRNIFGSKRSQPIIADHYSNPLQVNLLNILLLFGAIQSQVLYAGIYHAPMITKEDLKAIYKSPTIHHMPHTWLHGLGEGTVTEMIHREYRIKCIVDWIPKHSVLTMLELSGFQLIITPMYITSSMFSQITSQILYVLETFLIIPFAYPLDFLQWKSSQKLPFNTMAAIYGNIYPPYYTMWYLWHLTCIWHMTRPLFFIAENVLNARALSNGLANQISRIVPSNILKSFTSMFVKSAGSLLSMNTFHKVKGVLMAIPQIWCVHEMTHDLYAAIDINNPVHRAHYTFNAFAWWMDTLSMLMGMVGNELRMILPLIGSGMSRLKTVGQSIKGFNNKLESVINLFATGRFLDLAEITVVALMIGGYFVRTTFMMLNGIPGVFVYYDSEYVDEIKSNKKIDLPELNYIKK